MSAMSPITGSRPVSSPPFLGRCDPVGSLPARWTALCEAADVVAALAGYRDEATGASARFLEDIVAAGGWRLTLAAQGVDDLSAIMEAGLAALSGLCEGGCDPANAARALWQEYANARAALLALVPETA